MSNRPGIAYKVLTSDEAAVFLADGVFAGSPVDLADGYIHLSTAAQVDETVAKHFMGQSGLHVAAIDLAALGDAIRWEVSRGGQLFPHLYAPLPVSAVLAHAPLERDRQNRVQLPFPG